MLLLLSVDYFFSKLTFSKKNFKNNISVSNSLDPDLELLQHSVASDLGPNCCKGYQSPLARNELIMLINQWICKELFAFVMLNIVCTTLLHQKPVDLARSIVFSGFIRTRVKK